MICKNEPDRPSIVPEVYAESSGIRPGQVRVSPKYGGGFMANVEGLHHLHCLVRTIQCQPERRLLPELPHKSLSPGLLL